MKLDQFANELFHYLDSDYMNINHDFLETIYYWAVYIKEILS